MKKKVLLTLTALVCAIGCLFGLVACGDESPYYGKTYTLTGTSTIDWDGKNYFDTYGNEEDVSQRKVLEKHWDKIDWTKSTSFYQPQEFPHSNLDEFLQFFDNWQQNYYKSAKGLKISVSEESDLKLTLSLPETLRGGYDAEITMPFAETVEQLSQIKPHDQYFVDPVLDKGYDGIGIYKKDDGSFLEVRFCIGKFVKDLDLEITEYTVVDDGMGGTNLGQRTIFKTHDNEFAVLYDSQGTEIWNVRQGTDFEVA